MYPDVSYRIETMIRDAHCSKDAVCAPAMMWRDQSRPSWRDHRNPAIGTILHRTYKAKKQRRIDDIECRVDHASFTAYFFIAEVRKLAANTLNAKQIVVNQGLSYAHWGSPMVVPDNTYAGRVWCRTASF